jgi:DNA-binding protein
VAAVRASNWRRLRRAATAAVIVAAFFGIVIGTEDLPQEGGGVRAVSTIEITLKKAD